MKPLHLGAVEPSRARAPQEPEQTAEPRAHGLVGEPDRATHLVGEPGLERGLPCRCGLEHRLEPLLEPVGVRAEILEEVQVGVEIGLEAAERSLQFLDVVGGGEVAPRALGARRGRIEHRGRQARGHLGEDGAVRAGTQRAEHAPDRGPRRNEPVGERGVEEKRERRVVAGRAGGQERLEEGVVLGVLSERRERTEDAAHRGPRVPVEPAGNRDSSPEPVDEDDVPLVEGRRPRAAGRRLEDQESGLVRSGEARRRHADERDRRLAELARQEADVREHRAGERERPRRGEDAADVVGNRTLGEEHASVHVRGGEIGAITLEWTARFAGSDPASPDRNGRRHVHEQGEQHLPPRIPAASSGDRSRRRRRGRRRALHDDRRAPLAVEHEHCEEESEAQDLDREPDQVADA